MYYIVGVPRKFRVSALGPSAGYLGMPTLGFQIRGVPQIRAVGWPNSKIIIIEQLLISRV